MPQLWTHSVIQRTAALALTVAAFPAFSLAQHYKQTNLVSDQSGASFTDSNLVNPWGLSRSSGSPWWVSDNGTGLSTLYDASGMPQSLVVTIPVPSGQSGPATPTGNVFNFTIAFNVKPWAKAFFIFVTEDGTITGWNPTADLDHAILKVNHSGVAIYKGVAIVKTPLGSRMFVS